jgi:HD-GYP domain-containing protein (c-di-GMP phosphodiesterase class II)
VEEALVQLEEGAGTQFDPRIVGLFVGEYRRLEQEKTR